MFTFYIMFSFAIFICITYKTPKYDDSLLSDILNDVPKDWWLTSRRTVNQLSFKVHRDEKQFTNICTGHAPEITRVEQREMMQRRTEEKHVQKHKRKAEAMVAAQKLDSNFIRKQQLEHEAFGELIARTHVKNIIDKCTATKTKLDMLQGNKDIVIACYGEEEYNKESMIYLIS